VDQFETITKNLQRIAPHTIIDLGAGLSDANKKLLFQCNQIVVIVEPVPSTIIQTKALLKNLEELGINMDFVYPVLVNRTRLEITVPNAKVQQELGLQFSGVIMPAPELAYQAASRHEPLITFQPDSIIARQFSKLAETLLVTRK
jgi:Flp pilus assembly CpaE family ATPase